MPLFPFLAGASVIAATVAWALRVAAAEEPLSASSAVLVAGDALLLAVVATAGLLLARSRWARRLAAGLLAAQAAFLPALPFDGWTWTTLGAAGAALLLLAAPPLNRWVRRLPAASGPPPQAVALLLVLLTLPAVVGLVLPDGPGAAHWALAGLAVGLGWSYGRAHVAALWGLRLVFPAVGLAAAVTAGWASGAALAGAAGVVTALAWQRATRLSAQPLAPPRVETYRIPPELAPQDVLEAAGLDQEGRRRRPGAGPSA